MIMATVVIFGEKLAFIYSFIFLLRNVFYTLTLIQTTLVPVGHRDD